MKKNTISLSVPSSLKNLSLVRAMVKAYFEHEKISKEDSFQLLTVIDELSTNVVEHGYKYNQGNIDIKLEKCNEYISIVVEDNGVGFDDSKLSKEEGGLGLQIARKVADSFKIEKKINGTLFRLEKKIKEVV
ncbi:ATP-binding protein [Fusobacterium sp. PH5-44]|uniref:ATP-binding protein n=1 Tax=unclassified Fusobacterium TaxID=2648384 RepID=UPI003D19B0F2